MEIMVRRAAGKRVVGCRLWVSSFQFPVDYSARRFGGERAKDRGVGDWTAAGSASCGRIVKRRRISSSRGDAMGPRTFRTPTVVALCCLAAATAGAQVFVVGEKTATADAVTDFTPTRLQLPSDPLTERGRRELLQNLVSEQGFAHRNLPLGAGLTLLANGNMTPSGDAYRQMLYKKGQSAAPGDRVAITAVVFQRDRIILDLNGGPYAKHRFLSHIELNDNPVAQTDSQLVTGARVMLSFEGGVP